MVSHFHPSEILVKIKWDNIWGKPVEILHLCKELVSHFHQSEILVKMKWENIGENLLKFCIRVKNWCLIFIDLKFLWKWSGTIFVENLSVEILHPCKELVSHFHRSEILVKMKWDNTWGKQSRFCIHAINWCLIFIDWKIWWKWHTLSRILCSFHCLFTHQLSKANLWIHLL